MKLCNLGRDLHHGRMAVEMNVLRAYEVAGKYLEGIIDVKDTDDPLNVIICIVPEDVFRNCRTKSMVADPLPSVAPLEHHDFWDEQNAGLVEVENQTPKEFSPDFRRQLKARAMEHEIPIQLIRETTLRPTNEKPDFGERGLTPLSDRAWNISVALYYKAGGKPWILGTAREGVCYVGLVFKRTPKSQDARTACCVAQMFLDDGDGVFQE